MHDGRAKEHDVHKEVALRLNPKKVIEIGTYYGGITYKLSKLLPDAHFWAVQSYHDHKLNHLPETDRGEYSQGQGMVDELSKNMDPGLKKQDWKRAVLKYFPEEYHDFFDFNLLVNTFQESDNVSIILDTSPFKHPWSIMCDLIIFDISPLFEENARQAAWWFDYIEKGGHMLMGAYNHQAEFYDWSVTQGYEAEKIGVDYVLVRV